MTPVSPLPPVSPGTTRPRATDPCDPEHVGAYHAAQVKALTRRAAAVNATLTATKARTLVIRRGVSSWHCCDTQAAAHVLDQIKGRPCQ